MRFFFLPGIFQDFLFVFLNIVICWVVVSWTFILHSVFWASRICGLVSVINLEENSQSLLLQILILPLSLFSYSHCAYVIPFVVFPEFLELLNYSFMFHCWFCVCGCLFICLLFSFGTSYWHILRRVKPNEPLEVFLHLLYCFLSLTFLFLLKISNYLLTVVSFSCMFYTFPIVNINLLIIVVVNSCLLIPTSLPDMGLVLMLILSPQTLHFLLLVCPVIFCVCESWAWCTM